jgi:hypothetical protein
MRDELDWCHIMEEIRGYRFDVQKTVYLNHKKRKFW